MRRIACINAPNAHQFSQVVAREVSGQTYDARRAYDPQQWYGLVELEYNAFDPPTPSPPLGKGGNHPHPRRPLSASPRPKDKAPP